MLHVSFSHDQVKLLQRGFSACCDINGNEEEMRLVVTPGNGRALEYAGKSCEVFLVQEIKGGVAVSCES